jgi:general secretion pathway protein K
MKIRARSSSRGIALILVMCAIVVLSLLAAALAYSIKVETRLAQNADSGKQLLLLGVTGVQRACWILGMENCPYTALKQKWAGGPGDNCDTNGPLANILLDNYETGDGTVSLKIIDLERWANINTASATTIQQALTLMERDPNEISEVSDSIQDWIDGDDLPRVAGAESDYYQGLPVPYFAKNAPIDDLSELQYIRGVTPEIYSGHPPEDQPDVFHHKLGFTTAQGQPRGNGLGLTNFFTPFSTGKIDVNTADANVLQLIPGMNSAMADTLVKYRTGPDGVDGTEDDQPFQNVNQAASVVGLKPQQFGNLCDIRSSTYEVVVTAQLGDYKRVYIAILARPSGQDYQVMSFYWQ